MAQTYRTPTKTCPVCTQQTTRNAHFCPNCGNDFFRATASATPSDQVQAPPPQNASGGLYYAEPELPQERFGEWCRWAAIIWSIVCVCGFLVTSGINLMHYMAAQDSTSRSTEGYAFSGVSWLMGINGIWFLIWLCVAAPLTLIHFLTRAAR